MPLNHHRHSIRLQGYDYSLAGAYFMTMVIHNRQNHLGEIKGDSVILTDTGRLIEHAWTKLLSRYSGMESLAYITMPNHIHGLVLLTAKSNPPVTLAEIVRGFKTYTSRRINILRNTPNQPVWQRNYYEHIIRSDEELSRIYTYIADNPRRWTEDEEYSNPPNPSNNFP